MNAITIVFIVTILAIVTECAFETEEPTDDLVRAEGVKAMDLYGSKENSRIAKGLLKKLLSRLNKKKEFIWVVAVYDFVAVGSDLYGKNNSLSADSGMVIQDRERRGKGFLIYYAPSTDKFKNAQYTYNNENAQDFVNRVFEYEGVR